MKKLFALVAVLLLAVPAADLRGQTPAAGPAKGAKKAVKIVGELLDMGCFVSQGLRGAAHKECATKCINNGVPMGVVTADSVVYVLSQNHDRAMEPQSFGTTPDPLLQLRGWASETVEIYGLTWERKGYRFLEVKAAKLQTQKPAVPAKPGP